MQEKIKQKRILWYSDYGKNCMTGYATVSRNIIKQLKDYFGDTIYIEVVAINYYDQQYFEYNSTVRITSAKFGPDGKTRLMPFFEEDDFGRSHFTWFYKNEEWDAVFILQDISTIASIVPILKKIDVEKKREYENAQNTIIKADQAKQPVPYETRIAYEKPFKNPFSICYFPVDGPLPVRGTNKDYEKDQKFIFIKEADKKYFGNQIHYIESVGYFDQPITFTQFAYDQLLKQALPVAKKQLESKLGIIAHGTNTTDFYELPADEKLKFRKKYFGKNAIKTIIGVVNRNQPRKDIPTAIFGFMEAKKEWPTGLPEPFLYLHMHQEDPLGWCLPRLLEQTSLVEGKDYMFSKGGDENGQLPINELNGIYNSLDIYLSTAVGGGWELTVTEAMACKVPCIVPAHSSLKELGGDGERAWLLDEFLPFCMPSDSCYRQMCHFQQVAETILVVLDKKNINQTNEKVDAAYQWVKELEWDNVCRTWIDIFRQKAALNLP